jgi:hypothetical protein
MQYRIHANGTQIASSDDTTELIEFTGAGVYLVAVSMVKDSMFINVESEHYDPIMITVVLQPSTTTETTTTTTSPTTGPETPLSTMLAVGAVGITTVIVIVVIYIRKVKK